MFVTRVARQMTLDELHTAYQSGVPEFISYASGNTFSLVICSEKHSLLLLFNIYISQLLILKGRYMWKNENEKYHTVQYKFDPSSTTEHAEFFSKEQWNALFRLPQWKLRHCVTEYHKWQHICSTCRYWSFFRSTKTTIYITTAVVEADSIDYTRPIWLAGNAM
jgi:hypothetical protein